jgi:hypothetical protein
MTALQSYATYRDSKVVRSILIGFFALLLCYAIYEAWGLLSGPRIEVPEGMITVTEPYTLIKGRAERITELRLNGAVVQVKENGDFEQPYALAPGSNRLILEARDARGRTATEIIDIAYVPRDDN